MPNRHHTRYDYCNPNVHHEGEYPPKINYKLMGRTPDNKPELGQIAYDAYCEAIKMPYRRDWQDVPSDEQEAWQLAAKAVVTYTNQ